MEKQGLQIKQVITDRFDYQFADGTAFLHHYFIRLAFLDSWKEIIPKGRQIELFTLMETKMNNSSEQCGFSLQIPFVVIDSEK